MYLLLIEDDEVLGQVIARGLTANGYRVHWERDGDRAYDRACAGAFDVLVVDLMLPGLGGLDLLQSLRGAGVRTPALILTARTEVEDRVRGLDAGADDYLTKPFAFEELLARLRALLRRPADAWRPEALTVGNLRLHPADHLVAVGGRNVDVPPREFDLLEYMVRNCGQTLTRDQILERIWGATPPRANVADATASRLRRRLAAAGWDGTIAAVQGLGYRIVPPNGGGVR